MIRLRSSLVRLTALFAVAGWLTATFGTLSDGIGTLTYTREVVRNGAFVDYPDVYVHDLDHGLRINVTQTADYLEMLPAWSPDGLHLAYVRYRSSGVPQQVCVFSFVQPSTCYEWQPGWQDYPAWIGGELDYRLVFSRYNPQVEGGEIVHGHADRTMTVLDPLSREVEAYRAERAVIASAYESAVTEDRRWAAIPATLNGVNHLLLVDLIDAAAPVRQITEGRADYFYPLWRP